MAEDVSMRESETPGSPALASADDENNATNSGTASVTGAESVSGSDMESSGGDTEFDVDARLTSLNAIDAQIADILSTGADVVAAIAEGKQPPYSADKRPKFESAVRRYNQLVEEVNRQLRSEVKLLHDASHTELLPINVPVQASEFGQQQRNMIFESITAAKPGNK